MHGGQTHRARMAAGVDHATVQVRAAERLAGLADRLQLGVGAGVVGLVDLVDAAGQDPPVAHQHGADLKSTNRYGGTALIPACERGHVEVVKTLLQAGVDPNHVNKLGWTGLLEAILLSDGGPRHQEIVRLLIDAGADVNLADADSVSPLAHARQRGQGGIERLLLAAGAQ